MIRDTWPSVGYSKRWGTAIAARCVVLPAEGVAWAHGQGAADTHRGPYPRACPTPVIPPSCTRLSCEQHPVPHKDICTPYQHSTQHQLD